MNIGVSTASFYPLETELSLENLGKAGIKHTEVFFNAACELKQSFIDMLMDIKEEYGISHNALANWIKQYSEVKIDDNTVLTAKQIKKLQKRNAQLEEENLILKKAIAIFTPHSNKD